jgi:hypothetical protein
MSSPVKPNGRERGEVRPPPAFLKNLENDMQNGGEPDPAEFDQIDHPLPVAATLPAIPPRGIGPRELADMERQLVRMPLGDVATAVTRLSYRHMIEMCQGIVSSEGYNGPPAEELAKHVDAWAQRDKHEQRIEPR